MFCCKLLAGHCQVDGCRAAAGLQLIRSSHCGRDADHLASGAEGAVAGGTVLAGDQAMAADLEVVVDAALAGQDALAFSASRRLRLKQRYSQAACSTTSAKNRWPQ